MEQSSRCLEKDELPGQRRREKRGIHKPDARPVRVQVGSDCSPRRIVPSERSERESGFGQVTRMPLAPAPHGSLIYEPLPGRCPWELMLS